MEHLIKKIYKRTLVGRFIVKNSIELYSYCSRIILSEEKFVKRKFKRKFGYSLSLDDPKTLNEKINWLKLHDRTPLHTQCADKYAVRAYIKEKIGEEYLVPLFLVSKSPVDLNPPNLPEEPFIIKTNHDSGGTFIVRNKSEVNWIKLQIELKKRLKQNYYHKTMQWQYKNITPCVIVEKLLICRNGNSPFDYKLHCFNGKVNMIQVDVGRFSENHYRNWYNTNWEREPYRWSSKKGKDKFTDPSFEDVERPRTLEKMIELSETISKDFIYVRVDWYDVDDKLFFGEITFHHDGGYRPIMPVEWDLRLGNRLVLNPGFQNSEARV